MMWAGPSERSKATSIATTTLRTRLRRVIRGPPDPAFPGPITIRYSDGRDRLTGCCGWLQNRGKHRPWQRRRLVRVQPPSDGSLLSSSGAAFSTVTGENPADLESSL